MALEIPIYIRVVIRALGSGSSPEASDFWLYGSKMKRVGILILLNTTSSLLTYDTYSRPLATWATTRKQKIEEHCLCHSIVINYKLCLFKLEVVHSTRGSTRSYIITSSQEVPIFCHSVLKAQARRQTLQKRSKSVGTGLKSFAS